MGLALHLLDPSIPRYEIYDTMAAVSGRPKTEADMAYAAHDVVTGLTYRPIPQVAFKSDVVFHKTQLSDRYHTTLGLGLGLVF